MDNSFVCMTVNYPDREFCAGSYTSNRILYKIKKTMRLSFLRKLRFRGLKNRMFLKFGCSESNRTLKGAVFSMLPDMKKQKILNRNIFKYGLFIFGIMGTKEKEGANGQA